MFNLYEDYLNPLYFYRNFLYLNKLILVPISIYVLILYYYYGRTIILNPSICQNNLIYLNKHYIDVGAFYG